MFSGAAADLTEKNGEARHERPNVKLRGCPAFGQSLSNDRLGRIATTGRTEACMRRSLHANSALSSAQGTDWRWRTTPAVPDFESVAAELAPRHAPCAVSRMWINGNGPIACAGSAAVSTLHNTGTKSFTHLPCSYCVLICRSMGPNVRVQAQSEAGEARCSASPGTKS